MLMGEDNSLLFLKTVPTKYKDFCARLGPRGKSRSSKKHMAI